MKYKELKSLFYLDQKQCAVEYKKRFDSEDAVKLDFMIGENQAFFLQNTQVLSLALDLSRLDKKIYTLCIELPVVALKQYTRKCLIDEIVLSNKIEGVHSSRKEIGEVLDTLEAQSKERGKLERFFGLVNKYLMLSQSQAIALESCRDIRSLYDEVFLNEIVSEDSSNKPDGELFRKESVSVYNEYGKIIHKGMLPESKIISNMESAIAFLKDNFVEELFRVCIFHYLIEYIHPFYDGNGRLGRLIFSYGISRQLTPLVAFRISGTIKEELSAYYNAFKTCNDSKNFGDLTPFLIMQLQMIKKAMEQLRDSLEEKKTILQKYEDEIEKMYSDNLELKQLHSLLIQAALFSEKGISMEEMMSILELSRYKIKNLMELMNHSMVQTEKKGNTLFYYANLDLMDNQIIKEEISKLESQS